MKKTIYSIAALAMAATMAQAGTILIDHNGANLTVTGSEADIVSNTTCSSHNVKTASDYVKSFYAIDLNIGNGNTWTYELSFTLTEGIDLESIQLGLLTFNGGSDTQYSDRLGHYALTLSTGTEDIVSSENNVTYKGGTSSGAAQVDYSTGTISDGSGIVLNIAADKELAAGDYKLTLTVDRGSETNGYFVGIDGIQLTTPTPVPEPATASLSLLGLAALMMRRRRA